LVVVETRLCWVFTGIQWHRHDHWQYISCVTGQFCVVLGVILQTVTRPVTLCFLRRSRLICFSLSEVTRLANEVLQKWGLWGRIHNYNARLQNFSLEVQGRSVSGPVSSLSRLAHIAMHRCRVGRVSVAVEGPLARCWRPLWGVGPLQRELLGGTRIRRSVCGLTKRPPAAVF
jgi:hypothetical protein